MFIYVLEGQCHLCSDPDLELQLVLDALSPQVSECLESTDKDPELGIFACSRDKDPRCFGRVLLSSKLVCISSGLASHSCNLCVSILEKESGGFFVFFVMKKWESSYNICASVCIYKYT